MVGAAGCERWGGRAGGAGRAGGTWMVAWRAGRAGDGRMPLEAGGMFGWPWRAVGGMGDGSVYRRCVRVFDGVEVVSVLVSIEKIRSFCN